MTKIPVFVIDKLEVRKREFFFDKYRKFIKNRLCPMANKDDELIDIPSHTPSWHLGIVTFKLCVHMFGLCLKVFLHPYLSMQMRIVDKGKTLVGSFGLVLVAPFTAFVSAAIFARQPRNASFLV